MLAVFPLNIVVLPGEEVALHLFEPRYKQLYADFKNGKEFAIVFNSKKDMSDFGTLVYIKKVINEFPDDTVDLIVQGSQIIKIKAFKQNFPDKLYSGVEAEIIEHDISVSNDLNELFNLFLDKFGKRKSKSSLTIFQLANRIEMSQETKREFISQANNVALNRFLVNHIRFELKIREQENLLNQKFHLN